MCVKPEEFTELKNDMKHLTNLVEESIKDNKGNFKGIEKRFDKLPDELVTRREFDLIKWIVMALIAALVPIGIAVFK